MNLHNRRLSASRMLAQAKKGGKGGNDEDKGGKGGGGGKVGGGGDDVAKVEKEVKADAVRAASLIDFYPY